MILPIGDDNPNERTPYVHYGILAANVLVFFYMMSLQTIEQEASFVNRWALFPSHVTLLTLFSSLYIHAGLGHIFGNMLFLWIVGDNVEDRLGHVGYLVFYHVAGAAASLSHVAFTATPDMPLVGASGAISAVMGAYAVFFPNARIRIWYWILFFFDIVYISAKWAVGLWFGEQVLLKAVSAATHVSQIAYEAHIGGLLFGVIVAFVMKKAFLKEHDSVRRIVRPAGPGAFSWQADEAGTPAGEAEEGAGAPEKDYRDDNAAIDAAVRAGDLDTAFRYFARSAGGYHPAPLEAATVMGLGDALLTAGRYGHAARLYDTVTETFPGTTAAAEAEFRLGTVLSRVFEDYLNAREHLLIASERHPEERRRNQALDELKRIDSHLRMNLLSRKPPSKND